MRKVVSLVFCLAILMVSSVAFANYPRFLNGDENYILVDGHMGIAWYLDRSSIDVLAEDPPGYFIEVTVVTAKSAIDDERDFYERGGAGKIIETEQYNYLYNRETMVMCVHNREAQKWVEIDPWGPWAQTGIRMPAGEMAYYLTYGKKFYGQSERYSPSLGKYYTPFSDGFYDDV